VLVGCVCGSGIENISGVQFDDGFEFPESGGGVPQHVTHRKSGREMGSEIRNNEFESIGDSRDAHESKELVDISLLNSSKGNRSDVDEIDARVSQERQRGDQRVLET
jgi:hypothetical protein